MQFYLDNVGPIKSAKIELGALTIVCGKNNTGKTYLTNCLYEFYKMVARKCSVKVQEHISPETVTVRVDLERYRLAAVEAIRDKAKAFSESAASLHGGSFQVDVRDGELPLDVQVPDAIWGSRIQRWKYEVKKNKSILEISRRESVGEEAELDGEDKKKQWYTVLNAIVNAHLFRQDLNGGFFGDAFSMMSERMGIAYFKDCIDIALRARSQSSDSSADHSLVAPSTEMQTAFPLFPANVYAMMDMISYFGQRKKMGLVRNRSFLKDCMKDLELLTGGSYDVKDSKILFTPTGSSSLTIDVQDVSSSVRALFALDMYVRYFAEKGDLLVIDEPEMNLHPEKQRQLARFLARLVNAGIKVFITTHSDYILREFNILTELSGHRPYLSKIRAEEGYSDDELLRVDKVRAYVSREEDGKYVFDPAKVSEEDGLEIADIDSVIDKMNRIKELIDWGV